MRPPDVGARFDAPGAVAPTAAANSTREALRPSTVGCPCASTGDESNAAAPASVTSAIVRRPGIRSCEDIGPADPLAIVVVNSCWTAWERIKKAGGSKAYVDPNLLAMAVLYVARAPKNRTVDDLLCHITGKAQAGWRAEIPDWVLDMHTRRGRALGRNLEHFYREAAVLVNETGPNVYKDSPFIDRDTGEADDPTP